MGEKLRSVGHEYGATTGRPRRCGWLDLVEVGYTNLIDSFDSLCLTKLDVMTGFETIKVARKYLLDGPGPGARGGGVRRAARLERGHQQVRARRVSEA